MSPRRSTSDERQEAVRLVLDAGYTAKAAAEHLDLNARTVASWANTERIVRRGRSWVERVEPHFGFLQGHGFTVTAVDAATWWEVSVTYQSSISAVTVVHNSEFDRVEVMLLRLVDGNLPEDAWRRAYLADRLVQYRLGRKAVPRDMRGLTDTQVERQLVYWAQVLREHGADFLAGDFTVLDMFAATDRRSAETMRDS